MPWWWLLACSSDPADPLRDALDTSSRPPGGPATVVDVIPSQPWNANELQILLELSAPAPAAVLCTGPEPDEAHVVEATAASRSHELRVAGLLADTRYTCEAAALAPEGIQAVHPFEVTTSPLTDDGLPELVAETLDPGAGREYVLLNHRIDCKPTGERLIVVDREGRIRWHGHADPRAGPSLEFAHHEGPDGEDWFTWGGGWTPNPAGRPRQLELFGGAERYDSIEAIGEELDQRFHHDGKELDDGRFLTLEEPWVRNGDRRFRGFGVRRLDPVSGTTDFAYDSQRGFDEGHLPAGQGDVWHANWADIATVGDEEVLYVSLCFLSQVVAIDVATGEWRWTFGPGGDFTLFDVSGEPLGADQFPQCQHGLQTTGDRLLVYDNGWGRQYSRASEYALDESSGTATLLWAWTEDDWYEGTLGSVDWLPGGRVLVGMGHAECHSASPGDYTTVVEIDPRRNQKLWEARYARHEDMAYRADWADPCRLFANARYCDAVADRRAALDARFAPFRP